MKSSRAGLTRPVALPPSYHAFFSFPTKKSGYSGVATYTRTSAVVPLKAEEGLCSVIQPKPPLTPAERISQPEAYPQRVLEEEAEDEETLDDVDFKDLDSEGRVVVVDLGLFVLINVYCPNDNNGSEGRDKYKIEFHRILEARVKGLIEKEKREVIVVGDMNACAAVIDHCEGQIMVARGIAEGLEGEEGFWGKEFRRRMRDWLVKEGGTGGCMVDIVRRFWPDRKGMYTCWNTKISARETNYGTRIDYVLITQGLLPWVKAADIQPHIKGSDHCPVYLDLHDEIMDADGTVRKLCDVLGVKQGTPDREPPRLASKFWDEYSGKQMLLEKFFGRPSSLVKSPPPPTTTTRPLSSSEPSERSSPGSSHEELTMPTCTPAIDLTSTVATPSSSFSSPFPTPPTSQPVPAVSSEPSSSTSVKRKLTTETLSRGSSSKKHKRKDKEPETKPKAAGQTKLSTFFAKPQACLSPSQCQISPSAPSKSGKRKVKSLETTTSEETPEPDDTPNLESDFDFTMFDIEPDPPPIRPGTTEAKKAWSALLAPIQAPKCLVHGELTKEYTVNKPGPNKGKKFFICSRPVGPGYDKGRAERLREHVDPQWRCDFFKWSSDVKRGMRKGVT